MAERGPVADWQLLGGALQKRTWLNDCRCRPRTVCLLIINVGGPKWKFAASCPADEWDTTWLFASYVYDPRSPKSLA